MDDRHTNLVKVQKLLVQLKSDDPRRRYEACEEMRILPSLPDFALPALSEAAHDPVPHVADAAQRALALHSPALTPSPIDDISGEVETQLSTDHSGQFSPAPNGAGFWIRALARIIDIVFLNVIAVAVYFFIMFLVSIAGIIAGMTPDMLDETIQRLGGLSLLSVGFSILASIVFFATCESIHGSTLGKRICGLVVISEDGSPCGFWSALGRSFTFLIDALFFGLVAAFSMSSSPLKQRYGDKWFHTVVVKRSSLNPDLLRSGWRFIFTLFLAVSFSSLILFIDAMFELF